MGLKRTDEKQSEGNSDGDGEEEKDGRRRVAGGATRSVVVTLARDHY